MENVDMFNAATAPLTFHDFLDRMRHPQAVDLVKSIKSFIVDFMNRTPDAVKDSESVQAFLTTTEGAFEAHPLFVNATDEELDSAGEGLEKYLMTKLFSRAFSPFPEEVEHDQRLSEKMAMLQQFIRPEHLDIPPNFHESSWLLAQKELQKINTYKAPRDKVVCILNCCRVINNLLLNVSIGSKDNPPGADDFLPVLIYVVIKANPPQLHSNLLYINRYRHQSRLVSEAAYFYTNLVSAEHFIDNLEATSLSMDSSEFEKQMQSARALLDVNLSAQPSVTERHPPISEGRALKSDEHVSPRVSKQPVNKVEPGPGLSVQREDQVESRVLPVESAALAASAGSVPVSPKDGTSEKESMTVAKLETSGLPAVLEADKSGQLARGYPYLYACAGDLRVMDVEGLLSDYKEIVLKYVALCKAVEVEGTRSATGVRRVSSPLIDLREASGTSQTAGEIRRTKESNSPVDRLALGEDQAVGKEELRDVKTTEGVQDLFEGMSLLNSSTANNSHSPSFRDMAIQGHSLDESPRETDDQGSRGHGEEARRSDEHIVAEDRGDATREVIKFQDS
ncbi:hypothetical protein M758_12G169700 [Ceratodon purpureus]|nr:hypothetical protein M758_12G169700 [Ceratodon purpureus]KAG0599659.1 hypothetical protein M758_12G169700 [Ceratodon purpureus]KAG0599660.1 hypothetical protein M758_12G169700 [Ceratodon purpureus]KAG0599661.1 hypothetical protein M758_12G169700 [Ceratodon purpureus]